MLRIILCGCVCVLVSQNIASITGRKRIFSESFLLQLAHKQREQTTTLHWGNFLFDRCFGGESLVDKEAIRKKKLLNLLLLLLFNKRLNYLFNDNCICFHTA